MVLGLMVSWTWLLRFCIWVQVKLWKWYIHLSDAYKPRSLAITEVTVFNDEGGRLDITDEWRTLTTNWHLKDDKDDFTDYSAFRVQIAYTFLTNTFYVTHHILDEIVWPIYNVDELSSNSRPQIIMACLRRESGEDIDVTDTVSKYAGPKGDFYKGTNAATRVSWMFPSLVPSMTDKDRLFVLGGKLNSAWKHGDEFM